MSRIFSIVIFVIALLHPLVSESQTLSGPEVKRVNSDLFVSFSLSLDEKGLDAIRGGVDKELKFYVDLFRIWKIWPDEFVLGKAYVKTLKVDPIKKEYVATSSDGSLLIEKRFKSFESMMAWVVVFKDLKLTNIRELEPGQYFVRITVESKIRNLPPVIGYLFIFVSENEFRIMKDSTVFAIDGSR
ncbi:MAG: DUF4390 domain-containing protein [Nitrospirae bacterium]|nr:DUF4390 domain-containing protein [Nitrospirota bacterium]